MTSSLPLSRLEELARERTRAALEGWQIPACYRNDLTLGTFFENETNSVVFALYVARDRPEDALYLTRARLDRDSGEGDVEIYTEHLQRS